MLDALRAFFNSVTNFVIIKAYKQSVVILKLDMYVGIFLGRMRCDRSSGILW